MIQMDARLKVVEGAKTASIRLKLPVTVGRSGDASLTVPQSQVSRKHCEIYEEDGMLVIDDLGSSNGTFVNQERIEEPTFLFPGELLRVGKVTFVAEYEAPPELTASRESEVPTSEHHDDQSTVAPVDEVLSRDEPTPETEYRITSESVLNYNENQEGSFLGIQEIETGGGSTPRASSVNIELDESQPKSDVDPGDSALNDFFNNLG